MSANAQNSRLNEDTLQNARADILNVVSRYVKLTKRGPEYVACCPFHAETTPSFTVREDKGFFHCFGCGAHGDSIDFVMNHTGQDFREAVETILGRLPDPINAVSYGKPGARAPRESVWRSIRRAPEQAPDPNFNHYRLGQAAARWAYNDADGDLIGYVARFNVTKPDGRTGKETLPLAWAVNTETGEQTWRWLSFPVPRPMFGLDLLASEPQKPVLVVEGEKTAEAARAIFTGMVVLAWPGGGKAVPYVDWSPLAGRKVTLWPDFDWQPYPDNHPQAGETMPEAEQPGILAMRAIWEAIKDTAAQVRMVRPLQGSPDGWDLADPAPCEGFVPVRYGKENTVEAEAYFNPPAPAKPPANDNVPGSTIFGQPIDVFGVVAPAPLPIDCLPVALRNYVADQSDLLGSDVSIIGMTALVAAASCITDAIQIQPKRFDPTWRESARLWVAVVGDPSTRKSPAINKAVRHIKRIDGDMAERNGAKYADWKDQHSQWKEAKKGGDPGPEPKQPPMERLLVEDITVEALSEVLKDNARGVLCLQDELTGWFASMDAYRGTGKGASKDRARWLEAYNGGRQVIDRITRGSIIVPNWSACMIGGIQEDMIRRVSSSMGNDGLLQRFMVLVASPAREDADRVPDMRAMDEYAALFDYLTGLSPSGDTVKLTEAAHVVRERIAAHARRMIAAFDHPHMKAWLGKWDGLFARLLLLYHVIDSYTRQTYPTTEAAGEENALMVERLMLGFLLPHAIHFYTEILDANDRSEHARQLARLILARKMDRITKRDMAQLWKASRKLEAWEVRSVVETLCTMDWLYPEESSLDTDGKPRSWLVNPRVHSMFEGVAERERVRRADVVETLREIKSTYG